MKFVKWFAIIVVVFVVLIAAIGLMLPKEFELERSLVIEAQPEQVHALVGDLTRWDEWAPWMDEDPTIVTTLGAQTTGVGASQTWTSEKEGGGWLEFTRCDASTGVAYDMAFVMGEGEAAEEMPSVGAITYSKVPDGTLVAWSMSGEVDVPVLGGFLAKMLPVQIGPMFDNGLVKLKQAAEAQTAPQPAD